MKINTMLKCAAVLALGFAASTGFADDLRWVDWSGDCKMGTAANWDPQQVPQAGDNLTICWTGSGTKTVKNDLDVVYGNVTVVITNSSDSRVEISTGELRVSDGFSFLGQGGTVYFQTAVTGTGEFLVSNVAGTVYLPTAPTNGRFYSGDFMLRLGTLAAQAADVLGSETSHGKITICGTSTTAGFHGKLTTSGSGWSVWNDIYYDNTTSVFAFHPNFAVPLRGDVYFTGGGGTLQGAGSTTVVPLHCYGKWRKWTPEGRATRTDTLKMFVQGMGIAFHGGYEDTSTTALVLWNNANTKVILDCDVTLPNGIAFDGAGKVEFWRDLVSDDPLPLSLKAGSVVDLHGTVQKIGNITVASGAVPVITNTASGGGIIWSPTADSALYPVPTGDYTLSLDADGVVGTLGSSSASSIDVKAGTLVISSGAEMPNVTNWSVAAGATLDVRSSALPQNRTLRLASGANLDIANGVVLTVAKAYSGGERLAPGDYDYGSGTLHVIDVACTWTGAAGDGNLANAGNWDTGSVPDSGDRAIFASETTLSLSGSLDARRIDIGAGTVILLADGASFRAAEYSFGAGSTVGSAGNALLEIAGSGTYGDIPVTRDVVVSVTGGAVEFASASASDGALRLEAYAAAAVSVAAGETLQVCTFKVDGAYVNPGAIQAGEGTLYVYTKPVDPAGSWSVWTGGAGSANRSVFAGANWQGGETPDLVTGAAKLRFPDGAEVEVPSGDVRAYAIEFQGSFSSSGSGKIVVGEGGASVAAASVSFDNVVGFSAVPQVWNLSGAAASVTFGGALETPCDGDVYFLGDGDSTVSGGLGSVSFMVACAAYMNAGVTVSNALAKVRNGQALGRARGLTVWHKKCDLPDSSEFFTPGTVVKFPLRVHGHYGYFFNNSSADASLVFDEPVRFSFDTEYTSQPDYTPTSSYYKHMFNGSSAYLCCGRNLTFNAPVVSDGTLTVAYVGNTDGKGLFFNDTLTIGGRFYINSYGANVSLAKAGGGTWSDLFAMNSSYDNIVCGAENVFDPARCLLYYNNSGTIDMNGHDQTVTYLWANFSLTAATVPEVDSSGDVAVLHLTNAGGRSYPFRFTGKAGVEFVMKSNQSINLCNGVSDTAGPLIVSGGTLKINGTAAWNGSGEVRVASGAKVSAEIANALGRKSRVVLEEGGVLGLDVNQTVRCLTLGGVGQEPGTYGAVGSGAEHEFDGSYFSGTGVLTVLKPTYPTGMTLIFR